jgi:trans-2,3-dihydro-3-hydroxyanthranilate isomerase
MPFPNPIPPSRLTAAERLAEIADLLAAGVMRLRARMFSPLSGTIEDAATGSAATPLAALLLSLGSESEARYDVTQGVEMGRPSLLVCSARRGADGVRASVGGGCVPVLKGEISL